MTGSNTPFVAGKADDRQAVCPAVAGQGETEQAGEHQPVERQDSRNTTHQSQSQQSQHHQGPKHRLAKTNSGQASDKQSADKRGGGGVAVVAAIPVSASNNNQRPGKRTERPKSPPVGQK